MEPDIEALAQYVPEISESAKYWFVRTEGGELFQPFIASNSIAIGWGRLKLGEIAPLSAQNDLVRLKAVVTKAYPEVKSPGLAASQLRRFVSEMRDGDFVLIPSIGTQDIAIGRLVGNDVFEEPLVAEGNERAGYNKRRKVRWLARHSRYGINPNIWRILLTHQTIVDATPYARWIDPLLFDFFRRGNEFHYVVGVNREEHINARVLFGACLDLFATVDEFAVQERVSASSDDVDVRINLNSPGEIELIANTARFLFILALVVVCLNGGGFTLNVKKIGLNVNLHTDGLVKKINDFLNSRSRRQVRDSLKSKIDNLKIEDSKQIVKLLETIKDDTKK